MTIKKFPSAVSDDVKLFFGGYCDLLGCICEEMVWLHRFAQMDTIYRYCSLITGGIGYQVADTGPTILHFRLL